MADKEYIEREAVKEVIKQLSREPAYQHDGEDYYMGVCDVDGEIAMLPTADVVEVRHGRWLFHDTDENDMTIVKCSECGRKRYFGANYCPNCGAKMDGKVSTNDY